MRNLDRPSPLLDFVVSIVRLLDMTYASVLERAGCGRVSGRWEGKDSQVPVFIITWVVARLTFFLKPDGERAEVNFHDSGSSIL